MNNKVLKKKTAKINLIANLNSWTVHAEHHLFSKDASISTENRIQEQSKLQN
jgi:hypothetical protein